MKATETQNNNLIMGVSYKKKSVTDRRGVTRTSFIASVGNAKYQCFSLESLEESIKNHVTKNDTAAAQSFYDSLEYKGD